jgi:hypothetical protein
LEPRLRFLLLLAGSPALVLALHAAVLRGFRAAGAAVNPQAAALACSALGLPVTAGLAWLLHLRSLTGAEACRAWAYAGLVYGGLAYAYFHLFNLSETARRMRILLELASGRAASREQVERLYPPEDLLGQRLERLIALEQVRGAGGRYFLSGRALWAAARLVMGWARVLRKLEREP